MTRHMNEVPFDPRKPLFARKDFRANGRLVNKGDEFQWRGKAIALRKVRQLYDIRMVVHADSATFPDVPRETVKTKKLTIKEMLEMSMSELRLIAKKCGASPARTKKEAAERIHKAQ